MEGIAVLFGVFVVGMILFQILRGVGQTVENLSQETVDRPARVAGKRQSTSVSGGMNNMPATSHNHYYVTFQFPNGEREEFSVKGSEYGMLAEGDEGTLHSRGTWYQGFDRVVSR